MPIELPPLLGPIAVREVHTTNGSLALPFAMVRFAPWSGQTEADTFGGKSLLLVDGQPQFAEVAILRLFEAAGWQGRWVETYGKPRMQPALWRSWQQGGAGTQEHVPIAVPWVTERLMAIAAANRNSYSGCWDVAVWKGHRLVFVESKLARKDRLRATQLRWAEAAIACGMPVEDLLVVEWDITPR